MKLERGMSWCGFFMFLCDRVELHPNDKPIVVLVQDGNSFLTRTFLERVRLKRGSNMSMHGHCYKNGVMKMNFYFKLMLTNF